MRKLLFLNSTSLLLHALFAYFIMYPNLTAVNFKHYCIGASIAWLYFLFKDLDKHHN